MTEAHSKLCPSCKTPAPLNAARCAICGHHFSTRFAPSGQPENRTQAVGRGYKVKDIKGTWSPPIDEPALYDYARRGMIQPQTDIEDCQTGRISKASEYPAIKAILGDRVVAPAVPQPAQGGSPNRKALWAGAIAVVIVLSMVYTAITDPTAFDTTWRPLGGNVWTGVKVYWAQGKSDPQKDFVFIISGVEMGRIFVMYPDGTAEWKNRKELVNSGQYFVRSDDPAMP